MNSPPFLSLKFGNGWTLALPLIAAGVVFYVYNSGEDKLTWFQFLKQIQWVYDHKWLIPLTLGLAAVGLVSILFYNYIG